MKINFITFGDNQGKRGSTRIRVLNLIKALTLRGITCAFNDKNLEIYDLIVFQKTPLTHNIKEMIRHSRFLNIPIIFDMDDYSVPLMKQLKYFDLIIASTPYLAQMCSTYHPNVAVIPNMLDMNDIHIPLKKQNKHKSIVWYGYAQNGYILDKWHIQKVKRISNKKGDIPYDVNRIDKQLQEHDLIIIPQEKNENTLSKTHCRMLKALYLGIPCMVSDIPTYIELSKEVNFPPEFIISDHNQWNQKIEAFKKGKLTFDFDFERARQTILKKYGAKKIADEFLKIIKPLLINKSKPLAFVQKTGTAPLISVIIPISQKTSKTITSLKSILKQTLFDINIFLIGSSSATILNQYAQKDKRIHIVKDTSVGIEHEIQGKYIYFMQAGDWLESHALKRFYEAAEISEADVVKTQSFTCEKKVYKTVSDKQCINLITNMDTIPEFVSLHETNETNLYLRHFLTDNYIWQPEFQILPDIDFIYRVWSKCQKLFIIPENFVHCIKENLRRNQNQISTFVQYHLRVKNSLKNSLNAILLLIQDQSEIMPCFITLSSIVKNLTTPTNIYIVSLVNLLPETQQYFKSLKTKYLSINILAFSKTNLKALNLICYILQNWQNSKKLLYISNSCLALSNLDNVFEILPYDEVLLCQKRDAFSDKNVMLFNVPVWQKLYKEYPFKKKNISADMWDTFIYSHTSILSPLFNYSVTDYSNLSQEMLSKIKILCYSEYQPWQNLSIPLGYLWWQVARQSPFYEEILLSNQGKGTVKSKTHLLKKVYKKQDELSCAMNEFIKESLLYLITFGQKAKEHKTRLLQLHQQIINKVEK